jgi:integrase
MQSPATPKNKRWQKTKTQFLVRHVGSGRYYAIAYKNRKQIWKSLDTSLKSVALAKLPGELAKLRSGRTKVELSPKITFGEALAIHQKNLADDVDMKPGTLHYWNQIFIALLKSWPGLAEREIRRITVEQCEEWAREFRKTSSPTRWNNTWTGLRHVFDVAIRGGILHQNPAATPADNRRTFLKRRTPNKRDLSSLPGRAQFLQLVSTVQRAGGGVSRHCADFLRGLAFTGMRKGEAAHLELRDLDFARGETVVRFTKNSKVRRVPMIPEARELFERIATEKANAPLTDKVFRVRESQRAIDHACKKLGIPRITHHDLRHLFATTCIESGVDIKTLAEWLGHQDGGKLALDTYGHLRNEHSLAQAKRVSFGTPEPADNVVRFVTGAAH